jgi:lipopolysaccharide assembly protein B
MLDSLALTWFLLPLGAALGWALARSFWQGKDGTPVSERRTYLTGLEHLVAEDPDQAVAELLQAADQQPETAELQLTLGSLFRRRGEVDRALRLHENLLKRNGLDPELAQRARFELAQDYVKAGLVDNAEKLFRDLVRQGVHLAESLEALVAIYEQLRDWSHAIDFAQQLEAVRAQSFKPLIAQFTCERAENARLKNDHPEVLRLSARALSVHADCVRASLLQAGAHEALQDFAAAAKAYRRVPEQDPRFLREILLPLRRCQEKLRDLAAYWKFLEEAEERWPDPAPVLAKLELMKSEGVDPVPYLSEVLHKHASWAVTLKLMEQLESRPTATPNLPIKPVREAMEKLNLTALYQCHHCGLKPRVLFWQCPSCKQWGSITPATDPLLVPAKA